MANTSNRTFDVVVVQRKDIITRLKQVLANFIENIHTIVSQNMEPLIQNLPK